MSRLQLVNEMGLTIGTVDKLSAHENGGRLHRAVSVVLFDDSGRILIQRRSASKYHFAGKWANAACSHPFEGESLEQAGRRALAEEPGIFTAKNRFVTTPSIAIGACMIGGLFTRLASLGGGIFLLMIVAAKWQWPGHYAPPAHPSQGHSLYVTKEFIEMMVCFTMATLPTGRWAGLDYFLHGLIVRPFMRNKD